MKVTELKNMLKSMTPAQLSEKLDETQQELFKLKLQKVTGAIKDNSQFSKLRSQIARIRTLLHQVSN